MGTVDQRVPNRRPVAARPRHYQSLRTEAVTTTMACRGAHASLDLGGNIVMRHGRRRLRCRPAFAILVISGIAARDINEELIPTNPERS